MTKKCKYCGKEFETDRNYQKYCSKSCRNKGYREQHRNCYREYQKQYRQNHKDKLREYYRQYRQDHKDNLREYRRKYYMRYQKKRIKDSRYPCFEYIGHYVDKIPSEMCLNCSAERCRFDHD